MKTFLREVMKEKSCVFFRAGEMAQVGPDFGSHILMLTLMPLALVFNARELRQRKHRSMKVRYSGFCQQIGPMFNKMEG